MKKTLIQITLKNSCYCRGCYYSEDDWSLIGEGRTVQEAIDRIIASNSKEKVLDCYPEHTYIEEIDVIDFEGERYYSKKERDIKYTPEVLEHYGFPQIEIAKWIKTEKEIVDETRRSAQNIACSLFTDHPRRLQLKKAKERLKRFEGYLSEKIRLETERKQYERLAKQFGKAP